MIQLPNNKKCYNLPEQVAQNLLNIQYLAEQYKNIDELPAIWQSYKETFDADQETFAGWTTTFEGWDTTLATYLANMSSAAVGAIAGQNIAPANVNVSNTLQAAHAKIFEVIEDSNDHVRFVEGSGIDSSLSGLTTVFNKWSLSGSHIMFVIAGTIDTGTTVNNGNLFSTIVLPSWIRDKIIPVFATYYVEIKDIDFYADDFTKQTMAISLEKRDNVIYIRQSGTSTTFDKTRMFRIQFDLLIDNN